MLLWQTPIIDRTQADIDRVNALKGIPWEKMTLEQRREWTSGLKGCLNEKDFERIEGNIHILSDVLELGLMTCEGNIPYIPNMTYWANLLSNIEKIREAYSVHPDTPKVPEMPINIFEKVNNIEKILLDVYEIIMTNFYYLSIDGFKMGEEVGLAL